MIIRICAGSSCTMMGSGGIIDAVEEVREMLEDGQFESSGKELRLNVVKCLAFCKQDKTLCPVVEIDGEVMLKASTNAVMERIMNYVEG